MQSVVVGVLTPAPIEGIDQRATAAGEALQALEKLRTEELELWREMERIAVREEALIVRLGVIAQERAVLTGKVTQSVRGIRALVGEVKLRWSRVR